jgi:hypothetical protein
MTATTATVDVTELLQLPRRIALSDVLQRTLWDVPERDLPKGFAESLLNASTHDEHASLVNSLEKVPANRRRSLLFNLDGLDVGASEIRITATEVDGEVSVGFHFRFPGNVHHLFVALREPAIASHLASVIVTGEDEGANGTRDLDLHPLVSGDDANGRFPVLRSFSLERAKAGDHNRTIVVFNDPYEENGGIAKVLDCAPSLRELEVASAPSKAFFARSAHPLEQLRVSVGYAHQDFVKHLAESTCFERLATLEIVDFAETYMDGWEAQRVPLEHWRMLFESNALPALQKLVVVGSVLEASALPRTRYAIDLR